MRNFYILLLIFISCNSIYIENESIIKVINQYLISEELQESQKFYLNKVKLSDQAVFDIYNQVSPEDHKRYNKLLTLENGFLENGKDQFINKSLEKSTIFWKKELFNNKQVIVDLSNEGTKDDSQIAVLKEISDISKARLFSISDILFDSDYKKAIIRFQISKGIGNSEDFVLVLMKKKNIWVIYDRIDGTTLY